MAYRIVMLGPQGSGKGTQAVRLSRALGIPQITPGTMFRKAIAEGTELGKRVAPIVDAGKMVPDAITNAMVADRLREPDCANGFILDGYPRDREEFDALDRMATPITHAILLDIDDDLAVDRLSDRLMCICGIPYSGKEIPIKPGEEAKCRECNGTLQKRRDDHPEGIRRRLQNYHAETEPVVEEYRKRGTLVPIDGRGTVDAVFQTIVEQLKV